MTSIDELFKKPSLPGTKRKFEVNHDASQLQDMSERSESYAKLFLDAVYKSAKLTTNGSAKTNGHAAVEDAEDDEDVAAGPEMPAEEDEVPDDEDGRFFGGGVNRHTADVLDFIEEQDQTETKIEEIDLGWLRRTALTFEKKISKNAELRARYEDSPEKFMSSEADLDADIKNLSILAEHPELYGEFVDAGCVASLVSLLSHENTDIAIDAIEIIKELTDEDVDADQQEWDSLVDALLDAGLLSLLHENILRMDESLDSDRAGIYHILHVVENLSSRTSTMDALGTDTDFLTYLLTRIQVKDATVSQNQQYSAEVLAIFLQTSNSNRALFISKDGVDVCLQLLSPYRRRDPAKGSEEEEFVENLFDCLTCCVDDARGKEKFDEAEGIELCLIMLREGKMSKPRAFRLLDHSLGGPDGGRCCNTFVEKAGLKLVFGQFIKKQDNEATEHILGILSSLLRSLPANTATRIRLLAKFEEKDWRVIEKLAQTRQEVSRRIAQVDKQIAAEELRMSEAERQEKSDEWLSRRLDAGLFVLQTTDTILAWLAAEDERAREVVERDLGQQGATIENIKSTLKEQLDTMDDNPDKDDPMLKDIFKTLVKCL